MTLGDLNAEIAAVRIADTRIQEMCGKYGAEHLGGHRPELRRVACPS